MRYTILKVLGLMLLGSLLAACNLASGTVAEPTEVVLDATEETTNIPFTTNTPVPTNTPQATFTLISSAPTSVPISCTIRTDWQTYTVVGGDTLASIARRANTTLDTLVTGNCISNPNLLNVGQVLRVPNGVVPATVPPTITPLPQSTACQYFDTSGNRQAFGDQGHVQSFGMIELNRRYPIIERSDYSYHIVLPDGRTAWVQVAGASLEGNCNNLPVTDVYVPMPIGNNDVEICYYMMAQPFNSWYEQQQTHTAMQLQANTLYRVDARTDFMLRIVGGPDIGMIPVWVNIASGQMLNRCESLPNLSIDLTVNGPRTTYTDANGGGFAFDYPANWPIRMNNDGLPGGQIGTYSFIGFYPMAMGWPEDVVRVSWVITPPQLNTNPEQAARDYVQNVRDANGRLGVIEDVSSFTTASGIEVWTFVLGGVEAPNHIYLFKLTDKVVELNIQGSNAYGNVVIETLRPA